jgi:uncharacterized integral membrane protein
VGSYLKAIITIIILLFFITFGVKNSQSIQLSYYFNTLNVVLPLYGLVYISLLVGIFVGTVIGFAARLKLRRKIKNLEKNNVELKQRMMEVKGVEKEEVEDKQ